MLHADLAEWERFHVEIICNFFYKINNQYDDMLIHFVQVGARQKSKVTYQRLIPTAVCLPYQDVMFHDEIM